jgi:DNA-directed RNA polymerase subunit M/transcription elongation factor TFIIS
MARLQLATEDEAVDARIAEASRRYCPKCKGQTPHAFTMQINQGVVTRGWQCLRCGCVHG